MDNFDKKSEKISRLINLVISKLEPVKVLDEASQLWDSLVEMKKSGYVFTHNELKNLKKIGRFLSDLKAKNPQAINSISQVIEVTCSKCNESIKTLKQFINNDEKILCGACASKTLGHKEQNKISTQIPKFETQIPKMSDTAGIMRALSTLKLPLFPAHKDVDDAFKRVQKNRKKRELIKSKKIQGELAEIRKTQERSPQIFFNKKTSISENIMKGIRFCIECGSSIPKERIEASNANRCIKCQEEFEKTHDTRIKINEGLPGTREGHKRMRGQIWGEINKRNKGK
jgi:RNA polymerase-binding transcription factor DksA